MHNTIGYQGRWLIKCCDRCGQVFNTRNEGKEICSKCTSYLNELAAKRMKIHHRGRRIRAAHNIAEIAKLASERHMSYGEFVEKYGTTDPNGALLTEEG